MRTNQNALRRAVLGLLSHLEIEDCGYCDGTGHDSAQREDACRECGGIGEIVKGSILPQEVRALSAALWVR